MGLKEKLDNLDYGTLYEIWDEHVNQNSEPPKQWQLIEDLIGLAEGDSDAEAAILSDIENPDVVNYELSLKQESDNVSPIIIKVKSGVVVSVDNIPENCSVELWDYDTEGQSDNHLCTDSDGEKYLLNIF